MDHVGCLTAFVAVVEKGGFAAAGSSAQLPSRDKFLTLEDRVGARLLHRTTRKCSLTEAGLVFFASQENC
jgi:DNA-binding transcriptional LysR family regulator